MKHFGLKVAYYSTNDTKIYWLLFNKFYT